MASLMGKLCVSFSCSLLLKRTIIYAMDPVCGVVVLIEIFPWLMTSVSNHGNRTEMIFDVTSSFKYG